MGKTPKSPSENSDESEIVDFDEVLDVIGPRGYFQIRAAICLWFTCATLNMTVLSFAFVGFPTKYRCPILECGETSESSFYVKETGDFPTFLSEAFGESTNVFASVNHCQRFVFPDEESLSCDSYVDRLARDIQSANVTHCARDELILDDTFVHTSLITDYNFTCDQAYLKNLINAMYMLGMLLGAFLMGLFSDRFGRLKAVLVSVAMVSIAGSLCALHPPLVVLACLRVICGMGGMGTFMCGYVLAVEMVTPKYAVQMNVLLSFGFIIGSMTLTILAYLIREWRYLQLAIHAPLIVLLAYHFILPESPRWLISKKRYAEAKVIIASMARANGNPEPTQLYGRQNVVHTYHEIHAADETKALKITDIFQHRPLIVRLFLMTSVWFSVTMSFYGIIFTLTSLAGDPYLNFFLGLLTELPGIFFIFFSLRFFGRRITLGVILCLGGLSCIISGLGMGYNLNITQRVFAFVAKFCATTIFNSVFLYTAELYPTSIRNSVIGICSTMGRVGGVMALLLAGLRQYWVPLPLVIYGSVAILASLGVILLPETAGNTLPETIEEALDVGKHSSFKPCLCTKNRQK